MKKMLLRISTMVGLLFCCLNLNKSISVSAMQNQYNENFMVNESKETLKEEMVKTFLQKFEFVNNCFESISKPFEGNVEVRYKIADCAAAMKEMAKICYEIRKIDEYKAKNLAKKVLYFTKTKYRDLIFSRYLDYLNERKEVRELIDLNPLKERYTYEEKKNIDDFLRELFSIIALTPEFEYTPRIREIFLHIPIEKA